MRGMAGMAGILGAALLLGSAAHGESTGFDQEKVGQSPRGWQAGVTGKGSQAWEVTANAEAASRPNVLRQSGQGDYPWIAKSDVSLENGFVEVKFRPLQGEDDQAGGVTWRFQDGKSYYVARGNALENNVSLYYVENGKRKTLKYVDAPVTKGKWNLLRVEFAGKRIKVILNGKAYIELEDDHITGPGAVGLWTKADSVTEFDDFSYGK